MKRIITLVAALGIGLSAAAQSYDALWKKLQAASRDDLPKTALSFAQQLQQKALAEKNDAQLLRAELSVLQLQGEMAPDSATAVISRMEAALAAEQRPVVRALWHSALAQVYHARRYTYGLRARRDTAAVNKARLHATAALADMDALANARAKDWLPLFQEGTQSAVYGNDLLHVLLLTHIDNGQEKPLALLRRAIPIYERRGLTDGVLTLCIDSVARHYQGHTVTQRLESDAQYAALRRLADTPGKSECIIRAYNALSALVRAEADSTVKAHNDSLLCATMREGINRFKRYAAANRLRNWLSTMECATASLAGLPQVAYPGTKVRLSIKARHLSTLALRLIRISESSMEAAADAANAATRAKELRSQSIVVPFTLTKQEAWEWQTLETDVTLPEKPGVYYAELVGNGDGTLDNATVHISRLQAIVFAYPSDQHRVTVVDSRTGHPVEGARLVQAIYDGKLGRERQVKVFKANNDGTITLGDIGSYSNIYAQTNDDGASLPFNLGGVRYNVPDSTTHQHVDIFTDRAIYRPGQQVEVSGVAYTVQGDRTQVSEGLKGTLQLYDTNRRAVDSVLVQTDAWGAFAATLHVPEAVLNGRFSLWFTCSSKTVWKGIRMEEYRRPTFTTKLDDVRSAYAIGDTTAVTGTATTYTGVPVAGARVEWTVKANPWLRFGSDALPADQRGTTTTDGDGRFSIPVRLEATTDYSANTNPFIRLRYEVSYTVTAENGETTTGSTLLRAANRRAWLEHNIPATICRQEGKDIAPFNVRQVNAAGTTMTASGTYVVRSADGVEQAKGAFNSGKAFLPTAISQLPAGVYDMVLSTTADAAADTVRFTLFSDRLQRPIDRTQVLFAHDITSATADTVHVMVGTPERDVLMFCDVLSGGRLIESTRMVVSDTVLHRTLVYRPEYGDAADIYYAFVRGGNVYTHHASIIRPVPEKQLRMEWTSFRSRLTPGQQEEWRLKVTHPDGTPAASQVMACLYDASLDAFTPHRWAFSDFGLSRSHTYARWRASRSDLQVGLYGMSNDPVFGEERYNLMCNDFTRWRTELFDYNSTREMSMPLYSLGAGKMAAMRIQGNAAALESAVMDDMTELAERKATKSSAQASAGNDAGQTDGEDVSTRSNFAETAFFRPALLTDAKGETAIRFTLPESTTEWRFMALAHTKGMDYGQLDTTAIARKLLMVQPAMPRFVRKGDEAAVPVQLTNLTDKALTADVRLTLSDALTQQSVYAQKESVTLQAGEVRVCTFGFTANTDAALLVCRATASGSGHTDGEEHYLPVLSDEVEITRSLPLTLMGKGTHEVRIDTLMPAQGTHRALTVELTSNALWTVVGALPPLVADAQGTSATNWATRYFALTVARHIAAEHPEMAKALAQPTEADALTSLKLDGMDELTPWLRSALQERQRAGELRALFDENASAVRQFTALDKLRTLQGTDGGWSWHEGMPTSPFITTEVALTLARTRHLTDDKETSRMLQRAMLFLKGRVAEEVKEMKRVEHDTKRHIMPSELQLRYLYLRTLMGQKADDADASFLLARAKDLKKELSMYGKAVLAMVMADNGERQEAATAVQGIVEHTVATPDMGRYFDTDRATVTYRSFRIPTQCAAIEVLDRFGRKEEAAAMRQWLLQSKRTQMWETADATTEAAFALLSGPAADSAETTLAATAPALFTLKKGGDIVGVNAPSETTAQATAGYVRRTYTDDSSTAATSLTVRTRHDGTAWGAVYATASVPAASVANEGSGLRLSVRLEVERDGKWMPVNGPLAKGNQVRQVFTLTAARDYEFVSLKAARAACLEPARALSGYTYTDGLPRYRAVHNASTDIFIERLPKGTHTFTETFRTDRAGRYSTGISTAECVYSPEFRAMSGESVVEVR